MPRFAEPMRSTPRRHQLDACAAAVVALKRSSRVTLVLPCGTGKTLLGPMIRAAIPAQRVLVACPSIGLVRQTLDVWRAEGVVQSANALVVCSDSTAGSDDLHLEALAGAGAEVTTSRQDIRRWLSKAGTQKIVFSTYQSLPRLAEGLPRGFKLDLALFDEAHRAAQPENSLFGFALNDQNLPLERRVFMTATPRILSTRRASEDAPRVVVSMDDESVFGPMAYAMTFDDAMASKLIAEYQVLVSAVTSQDIDTALLHRSDIVHGRSRFRLDEIAGQVALVRAMESTGETKAITFHYSIGAAQRFAVDVAGLLASGGVHAFHVNGEMKADERARIIRNFDAVKGRAVLTNARCLTEGIDLPDVGIVGFMSPKSSEVDVVQALGRALRITASKKVGYALVPLLLEPDQPFNRALGKSRYGVLWDVLAAIESGHLVTGTPTGRLRTFGHRVGDRRPRVLSRFRVLADPTIVDGLATAIEVRAIEILSGRWNARFEELVTWRTRHGGKNPAATAKPLGQWLQTQRKLFRAGRLHPERVQLFEEAGVSLGPQEENWTNRFNQLKGFIAARGHARVPVEDPELGVWVVVQRHRMRAGRLAAAKVEKLRSVGFIENVADQRFEERFHELLEYALQTGSLRPSFATHERLAQWCQQQRLRRSKKTIKPHQAQRLTHLGFPWNGRHEGAREDRWALDLRRLALHVAFERPLAKDLAKLARKQRRDDLPPADQARLARALKGVVPAAG